MPELYTKMEPFSLGTLTRCPTLLTPCIQTTPEKPFILFWVPSLEDLNLLLWLFIQRLCTCHKEWQRAHLKRPRTTKCPSPAHLFFPPAAPFLQQSWAPMVLQVSVRTLALQRGMANFLPGKLTCLHAKIFSRWELWGNTTPQAPESWGRSPGRSSLTGDSSDSPLFSYMVGTTGTWTGFQGILVTLVPMFQGNLVMLVPIYPASLLPPPPRTAQEALCQHNSCVSPVRLGKGSPTHVYGISWNFSWQTRSCCATKPKNFPFLFC